MAADPLADLLAWLDDQRPRRRLARRVGSRQARSAGGEVMDEDEPIPAPAPGSVRKCGRLQWCAGMSIALHGVPENSERKGLSVIHGWLGDDKLPRRIGVTYHAKARDVGLILNYCPWCGIRIRFNEASST